MENKTCNAVNFCMSSNFQLNQFNGFGALWTCRWRTLIPCPYPSLCLALHHCTIRLCRMQSLQCKIAGDAFTGFSEVEPARSVSRCIQAKVKPKMLKTKRLFWSSTQPILGSQNGNFLALFAWLISIQFCFPSGINIWKTCLAQGKINEKRLFALGFIRSRAPKIGSAGIRSDVCLIFAFGRNCGQ